MDNPVICEVSEVHEEHLSSSLLRFMASAIQQQITAQINK
jgi:hypothetical protein